jgi:phage baseplate assembly protein W
LNTKKFLGVPYPVKSTPKGFFYSQDGINQIKSDLLCLLLTNPGERVMTPNFGTPLRRLLFEPNDLSLQIAAKNMIIDSISTWEPRIAIQQVQVMSSIDRDDLNNYDDLTELEHILYIKIEFIDPQNISEVQELVLEVPLAGAQ